MKTQRKSRRMVGRFTIMGGKVFAHTRRGCGLGHMGCVDCGGDNNWDNCDALETDLKLRLISAQFDCIACNRGKGRSTARSRGSDGHGTNARASFGIFLRL
jgi:hypothetical protein